MRPIRLAELVEVNKGLAPTQGANHSLAAGPTDPQLQDILGDRRDRLLSLHCFEYVSEFVFEKTSKLSQIMSGNQVETARLGDKRAHDHT